MIMTFSSCTVCDYLTRVLCGVFGIVACVLYKRSNLMVLCVKVMTSHKYIILISSVDCCLQMTPLSCHTS